MAWPPAMPAVPLAAASVPMMSTAHGGSPRESRMRGEQLEGQRLQRIAGEDGRGLRRTACGRWAGRGAGRRRPWPAGRRAPANSSGSARPHRPAPSSRSSGSAQRLGRWRRPAPAGGACRRPARCSAARRAGAAAPPSRAAASASSSPLDPLPPAFQRQGQRLRSARGCRPCAIMRRRARTVRRAAVADFCSRISTFCSACLQRRLAVARQRDAALELLERLLERQVAVLELVDGGFEVAEGALEVRWGRAMAFRSRHEVSRGPEASHTGPRGSTRCVLAGSRLASPSGCSGRSRRSDPGPPQSLERQTRALGQGPGSTACDTAPERFASRGLAKRTAQAAAAPTAEGAEPAAMRALVDADVDARAAASTAAPGPVSSSGERVCLSARRGNPRTGRNAVSRYAGTQTFEPTERRALLPFARFLPPTEPADRSKNEPVLHRSRHRSPVRTSSPCGAARACTPTPLGPTTSRTKSSTTASTRRWRVTAT